MNIPLLQACKETLRLGSWRSGLVWLSALRKVDPAARRGRSRWLQLLPNIDVNRLHDATDTGDDFQVISLRPGAIQRSRQLGDAGLLDSQQHLNVVAHLFQATSFNGVGILELGQIELRALQVNSRNKAGTRQTLVGFGLPLRLFQIKLHLSHTTSWFNILFWNSTSEACSSATAP